MKNIHILPTDKPSRLHYFTANKAGYYLYPNNGLVIPRNPNCINQNICITNDEEIKDGDWFIQVNTKKRIKHHLKNGLLLQPQSFDKKIILTTDPDLIADGVQAIDDEFLQWFVKNPSCDEVYIVDDYKQVNQDNPVLRGSTNVIHKYKIIIPKQESKQLTDLEIAMKLEEIEKEESNRTHWLDELPNMDKNTLGKMWEAIIPKLEPKQETIEEAAKSTTTKYINEREKQTAYLEFIEGAKWQAERMYSEEEVLNLLHKRSFNLKFKKDDKPVNIWFGQHKKK
jgi:hypothetical protein